MGGAARRPEGGGRGLRAKNVAGIGGMRFVSALRSATLKRAVEEAPVRIEGESRSPARTARVTARLALLVLAFGLLTVAMTWPLAPNAGRAVQDLGDPLYEIWSQRWTQHQLLTAPGRLWDANILHPLPRTLLFAEPALGTALLAWPIQLLTGNDVLAYNLLLLATFVVLGVGMALLVEELSGSPGAGTLAGALAAYTPYRFGHISHLNLLGYGWTPLALWALARYARRGRAGDAALAALFLTIQFHASDTLAALALGTVGLALPFLLRAARGRLSARWLGGLLVALTVPVLAFTPVIIGRLEVNRTHGFARDVDTVRQMSATWRTYLAVSPGNLFWRDTLPQAYPSPLFPGAVAVAGVILALGLAARAWPRWTLLGAALATAGAILSLGPETEIAGRAVTLPYRWLYDSVPGMAAMRDATRFGTVALLGLHLLAGLGFAAAWATLRARLPARWVCPAGAAALALPLALVLAESRHEIGIVEVPRDPAAVAVYDWLAVQPRGAVMEIPANGLWTDLTRTTRQMYGSTRHRQPIVAGYSSFVPRRHTDFLLRFHGGEAARTGRGRTISEVSAANVGLLQDLGVRYVVIHRAEGYDWRRALAEADKVPALTRAGAFGDAAAYRLDPGRRRPLGFALATPAVATAGGEVVAALIARNDNDSSAIAALDQPSRARVSWTDAAGNRVKTDRPPVELSVVDPGVTGVPIAFATPATPGTYRLHVRHGALAAPLAATVEVRPAPTDGAAGPPVVLRRVTWAERDHRPGEAVELLIEWEARAALDTSYTVAAQLLGPDGRLHGQWDARPFRGARPTTAWRPGDALIEPVAVRLAPEAPPGAYRVVVALYDERNRRLPLELPDGATATEGLLGPLHVGGR